MARGTNRETPSAPGNALTRAESLVIVQTCLHSCLSAVLHARELLPEKAFVNQEVIFDGPAGDQHSVNMILIKKGPSTRANHLLGWLNDGVFSVLRQGHLSGFQICIHPDPKRRNRALETYTFTIQYSSNADGKLLPEGVSLETLDDDQSVLMNNAGRELHKTLDTITALCESMPELPKERFLSMNLFLLPNAAELKTPDGFMPARREAIVWPRHAEWERQTEAFSTIPASSMSTRLKVSYMAPSHEHHGQQPDMSVLSDYIQAIPVTDDIDWNLAKIHTRDKGDQGTTSVLRGAGRPSLNAQQPSREPLRNDERQVSQVEMAMPDPHLSRTLQRDAPIDDDTQMTAMRMKLALEGMAQVEQFTQGDTQAASLPPALPAAPAIIPENIKPEYNYINMRHRRADASVIRRQAQVLSKEIGGMTRSGQIILCQCAYSKEEGDMMRCTHCHTWQHAHCYGYVNKDDPRRPGEHMCYICFVDPRDLDLLQNLIDLALGRRAIFQALRHGIMGKGDFADKLGMDGSIAHPLFEIFKREGYIIAASGSHKAGFKTSGRPPWVPGGEESYGRVLNHYFNPVKYIEAYFKPYNVQPSWLADKLIIAPVGDLPAAATPLAQRQKRKRTTVAPSSSLDSPSTLSEIELAGTGGTTRRGSTYKPPGGFEDDSETDEEFQPKAKQARAGSSSKNTKSVTPAKRKLISLESYRIIDVCTSSGGSA